MGTLREWWDDRAGFGAWWQSLRNPAPSGAALAAVIGLLLLNQAVTGACLAAYYKPTVEGAYASVELILYGLRFGWLLRSLHLWGQHLLVIVLLFAALRTIALGTYRKPRELTWWALVALLFAVLGSGQTGQVLPLDEDGWNGALVAAGMGGGLGRLVLGGDAMSDLTMGRFYAAHLFFLPGLWALLFAARHAIEKRHPERPPRGTLLEATALAALATLAALSALAVLFPPGLGPKGSAVAVTAAAKPHWYLLPVYQGLKFLDTTTMRISLGAIAAFLAALPALPRKPALFGSAALAGLLGALGVMGAMAK